MREQIEELERYLWVLGDRIEVVGAGLVGDEGGARARFSPAMVLRWLWASALGLLSITRVRECYRRTPFRQCGSVPVGPRRDGSRGRRRSVIAGFWRWRAGFVGRVSGTGS